MSGGAAAMAGLHTDARAAREGGSRRPGGGVGERVGGREARSSPFNSTIHINTSMSLPSTMKGRSPLNTVIQNTLHKCNKTISFHLYMQKLN